MTIDFYIDQPPVYIGCASYDSEAGLYEANVDLSEEILDKVEKLIDSGNDYGYVDDKGQLIGVQYVRRTK